MRKLTFLLTAIILMLGVNSVKATHIQGMNISYKHINGDTFVITLDFWRYCGGTAFSPSGTYQSAAGGTTSMTYDIYCDEVGFSSLNRTAQVDTFFEASPICAAQSFLSSCGTPGSGLLGIQWFIYTDTLILSELNVSSCNLWKFVYDTGARNSGTNYISQPSIAVYNEFAMSVDNENSSVQFNTVKPIPFFCDGQQVVYNWGATELDGDSLYWEFDTAAQSYSSITQQFSYISYNTAPAGMGAVNGLEPIPGITINSATGQVEFTAYIPPGYQFANYAVAVKVSEYNANTGAYKGTTQRDVQFIILDSCDNNPPTQNTTGITNFQGSGALLDSNTVEVCFGQNFEFELIYFDYDTSGALSSDSINVSCNIGDVLPGAQWSHTGTNPDTVSVSWTAIPTPITFAPFNITVEDDFCPITGFNIYNYLVKITPSTFLPADTAICNIDTIQLPTYGGDTFVYQMIMNPDSTFGNPLIVGQSIQCNPCIGIDSPWIKLDSTTTIRVVSNLSATCGNEDTITITAFGAFPISFSAAHGGAGSEFVYCASDGLDTINGFTPGGVWLGSGIVNPVAGVFAPDVLNPGTGNDTLVNVVYVINTEYCPNQDTISILVKGLPDASILSSGPYCVQSTSLQLTGAVAGGTWLGPNTTTAGVLNPSAYAATAPDTIMVYHTLNDSGCVNTDSADIRIINEFSTRIDSLPKICAGESVVLYLNAFEGDPNGIWKGDKIIEQPANSGNYYFDTKDLRSGTYPIRYEIEGECGTFNDTNIVINPLPDASIFGADSVYCDNILDSVLLTSASERGIWGGSMTELHDGYFVPNDVGEGLYTITYELYDTLTTCYNKNIVPVRIARTPVKPQLYGGGPYCQGTAISVRADGLLSNTFKWFGVNGGDSVLLGAGNPFAFGEVVDMPTIIYGTQVSQYGCESPTQKFSIEVLPAPIADFIADTLYGNVPLVVNFTNLSGTGLGTDSIPLTFEWTFANYATSTDSNTSFVFEDIGTYAVTLLADNSRCTDTKTVYVTADKLTHFFIPNVFSPNGDNINDYLDWKIDGIGEFKISVYNRWGDKVYQTEDIEEFWDGGKESSGVYYYIMTGKELTLDQEKVEWRGNVTLIRD
ncbi:MAG: gliding motility-associated C-terminal domain-containing protein [Salibacteraceae bacterium]|nr:gliding motility-associated C-terminal domain-containing protein [Salibacteraceae bacterium]